MPSRTSNVCCASERGVLPGVALATALVVLPLAGQGLRAQERLTTHATWSLAPAVQETRFADPPRHDSLLVRSARQLVVPLTISVPFGERVRVDATAAWTASEIWLDRGVAAAAAAPAEGSRLRVIGATDVRLRLTGQVLGDALSVTVGVNAPSGRTRLGDEPLSALRVVGAPALRFPVATLGSGFGTTVGVISARAVGAWAFAGAASYERRSEYTPIEATIAGLATAGVLRPGSAVHVSAGVDGVIAEGRVSAVLAHDVYGTDRVRLAAPEAGVELFDRYRLGPTTTASVGVELPVRGFREISLRGAHRWRAAFTDGAGRQVEGSAGRYADGGIAAVVGGTPGRVGLRLAGDARWQSGLAFESSFATAAVRAVGATAGVILPSGPEGYFQPWVRAERGTLDTGVQRTALSSLAVGVSLGRR